jgi:hypothetical protein
MNPLSTTAPKRIPRWVIVTGCIVGWLVLVAAKDDRSSSSGGSNSSGGSYSATTTAPQAAQQTQLDIPTETVPPSRAATDDDGMLVNERDKQLRALAVMGVYSVHCGELPASVDRGAAALMRATGKDQMMPHILKVDEVRHRFGNVRFCAAMRAVL